jgi:diphthine methyl ester synthase
MLEEAKTQEISFLVVGDPFCATTHADLFLRARALGIEIVVIHNASIFTAVALTGMQLYKFGETVSLPFFTENWRPYSFYDKILRNREKNLHTLLLLDIKIKEQSEEDLIRGRMVFQPPRFMTVNQAARQMIEAEKAKGMNCYEENTEVILVMRLGSQQQAIVVKTLGEVAGETDFGPPLHSIVLPGEIDEIEREMMDYHRGRNLY